MVVSGYAVLMGLYVFVKVSEIMKALSFVAINDAMIYGFSASPNQRVNR